MKGESGEACLQEDQRHRLELLGGFSQCNASCKTMDNGSLVTTVHGVCPGQVTDAELCAVLLRAVLCGAVLATGPSAWAKLAWWMLSRNAQQHPAPLAVLPVGGARRGPPNFPSHTSLSLLFVLVGARGGGLDPRRAGAFTGCCCCGGLDSISRKPHQGTHEHALPRHCTSGAVYV